MSNKIKFTASTSPKYTALGYKVGDEIEVDDVELKRLQSSGYGFTLVESPKPKKKASKKKPSKKSKGE
tara:strand:- start:6566 stop:6769 length:204 start_codon:yes stop_codon:yes gene_type:complete